eukprot:12407023-Karenia_brevis.AAC.1
MVVMVMMMMIHVLHVVALFLHLDLKDDSDRMTGDRATCTWSCTWTWTWTWRWTWTCLGPPGPGPGLAPGAGPGPGPGLALGPGLGLGAGPWVFARDFQGALQLLGGGAAAAAAVASVAAAAAAAAALLPAVADRCSCCWRQRASISAGVEGLLPWGGWVVVWFAASLQCQVGLICSFARFTAHGLAHVGLMGWLCSGVLEFQLELTFQLEL